MSYRIHRARKRKMSKKEPDLFIDKAVMVAAFVSPIAAIPQIIQLYHTQSAQDISLASWTVYQIVTVLWLIYGIKHKELPIIIYQGLWFVAQSLVIIAILLYGDVSTLWSFGF